MRALMYMPKWLDEPMYPMGFPLNFQTDNWHGNVKEELMEALKHYYNYTLGETPVPAKHEEELLIEFLIYYINAPIWRVHEHSPVLLEKVKRLETVKDIAEFLDECLEIGLDPF